MRKKIGAEILGQSCRFCVWAPHAKKVELVLKDQCSLVLKKEEKGYWTVEGHVAPECLYKYVLDGQIFPDPASRFQPEGVHGWSQVVSEQFPWKDLQWKGLPIAEMVIYELHVGTFSKDGSFEGTSKKLDHLLELGVNTIEIMPVAQFPGDRNWGYDGVFPFAVQDSYGGPKALKHLVDSCHQKGIAVLLDVVYNHLGPEGNYLSEFGPYFTDKYQTPWGNAINFDDEYCDEVRNFFLQNAQMWLEEFHFDGLRLDAVHEIIDRGALHFLQELSRTVDALEERTGRKYVLIAESDLNDVRFINSYSKGGFGLEGQWVDDFHHSLHTYLTGEDDGYYSDYGKLEFIKKALQQAFVFDGIYSSFRKKTLGNSPKNLDPAHFVVCIQNHDQVGNRLQGERLAKLISFEAQKLAAGILLISPFVPMLFMGEEFGARNPFLYFINHSDPKLVKAVQEGRKQEFEYFLKKDGGEFPDPQAQESFQKSKLSWQDQPEQRALFKYYKRLLHLRRQGTFAAFRNSSYRVSAGKEGLIVLWAEEKGEELMALCNFSQEIIQHNLPRQQDWELLLASTDTAFGGTGVAEEAEKGNLLPPQSLFVFRSPGPTKNGGRNNQVN